MQLLLNTSIYFSSTVICHLRVVTIRHAPHRSPGFGGADLPPPRSALTVETQIDEPAGRQRHNS